MRRLFLAIGLLALLLPLAPFTGVRADTPLDFDIPNGHFFKEANGQGGAGDAGFAVTDDDSAAFWTAFQAFGGVPNVGFPVSQRFVWNKFTVQAFQKVVFQWHPENNAVAFVNVFDELSAAGKDDFLLVTRSVPKSADWSSDQGKSFDQVIQNHFALLDLNPAIKQVYLSASDPVALNGLPMGAQDFPTVFVIRAQRKVFQQWKVNTAFANAGDVTVANGGDVGKEAGLYPADATVPTSPPGAGTAPTQVSPGNGAVLRVIPRVATFTWNPIPDPTVTYNIEVLQQDVTGALRPIASASGLTSTTYTMPPLSQDGSAQWRVWATSPTNGDGPKSSLWTFHFNTDAGQYAAVWLNDDANTTGITKILISNTGQTLMIEPLLKSTPADTDLGTKSIVFGGEPIKARFQTTPGGTTHDLTITLFGDEGKTLKVVDDFSSGAGGGAATGKTGVYTFHRS